MSHDSPLAYRADIDGLRGIAVLLVIAFHAFPTWFKGGFIGVDVFFVISGFLISSIIFKSNARGNFSFLEFYARRARRLFPALFVVLIASGVLGWIYLFPDEYRQLGKHIAAGAAFVQNFLLWHEVGYFDTSAELKPLMHLWSLAVEEQFYLVYPVAVWVLWRRRMNVLTAIVVLACISFSLNISRVGRHPAEAFFLLHSRFWELLEGGILAYIQLFKVEIPGPTPRQRNALSIMGVLLIATAVCIISKDKAFPGWWAQLPVTGTLLLVLAGPSSWINRLFLGTPAMSFLGRISYPLYLWHWTLLSFARIDNPDVTALARAGLLVLSFVLAWITYQFVEKPIRFGRHPLRRVSIGMVSALFTAGVVGFLIFHLKGVPSRLPESGEALAAVKALAAYQYNPYAETRVGECWLSGTQAPDGFAEACYGNLLDGVGDRTIVLWGDSHAACLFPGVRAVRNDTRSVAQFTKDSCPPLLGYALGTNWGTCEAGNQFVASVLKKHPQATVILFAAWTLYSKDWTAGSPAGNALLATIRELHDGGVTRIIVMGPSPWWKKQLSKLVIKLARSHFQEGFSVPSRMNFGLDPAPAMVDEQLRTLLAGSPATYFSVFNTLCDSVEGCLVRTTDQQTSFTAFDYGHLTVDGARIVAGQLPLYPAFEGEHRHLGAKP